jgi:hypothetical protein
MFSKKNYINSKNPLSRFLARTLDYCFVYIALILPLFFSELIESDLLHFVCIALVPLIWMPLEALAIHYFSTTPGKFLFGITIQTEYGTPLSLKESFERAFLVWTKGLGCNLPLINLFCQTRAFNQIYKFGKTKQDAQNNIDVLQKKRRSVRNFISAFLLSFFSLFFIAEYELREVAVSSNSELFSTKLLRTGTNQHWNLYKDPQGNFQIKFPGKPDEDFTKLPIPKSKETLPFYSVNYVLDTEDIEYSLSYSAMPKSWLKWKPSLFLKGALKIISSKLTEGKIIKKSSIVYDGHPALEFVLEKKDNQETSGFLILIDNILYKVDMTYPKEKKEEIKETLSLFLNSFSPN